MSFFFTVEVGQDKPQNLVPPFLTELRQNKVYRYLFVKIKLTDSCHSCPI